jgi:hypothetical protein
LDGFNIFFLSQFRLALNLQLTLQDEGLSLKFDEARQV